jgi:DNA-binding NarL/FixJ family response regulator
MSDLQDYVLVVEDEFLIAAALCVQLEDLGMKVCGTADTAERAVALAQEYRPSLVLMDVRLKGQEDGVDAALAIHATVGSKVIFITGSREPATITRIRSGHPAAVLFKPSSFRQLQTTIESVMRT